MPFVTREGVRLYWRSDGDPAKPALLFLNSLGTDHAMWDAVTPQLARDFRVLRMDTRGHGASDAPKGDYTIPMLAADALAVLDAAGAERAHICGLSMGGMTVFEIAAEHPARIDRIIAANTSAEMPRDPMRERADLVRQKGMAAVAETVLGRFLTEDFRKRNPAIAGTTLSTLLTTDPIGYSGCCMAISRMELAHKFSRIKAPLLVINGAKDISTPAAEHGDRIAAAVSGARKVTLDAGHLSAVETADAFAAAVLAFLNEPQGKADVTAARKALFEAGLAMRRAVLGDEWVDKSLASRDALTHEFQDLITRVRWSK
jgi:3-oxoadipate enol-lactonase/4-carboxymuconolactone decarboxylase